MSQQGDEAKQASGPDEAVSGATTLFEALGLGPEDPLTEAEVGLLQALHEQGMRIAGLSLGQDADTGEVRIQGYAPQADPQAELAGETGRLKGIDARALNGFGVRAYGDGQYSSASACLRLALRLRLVSLGAG